MARSVSPFEAAFDERPGYNPVHPALRRAWRLAQAEDQDRVVSARTRRRQSWRDLTVLLVEDGVLPRESIARLEAADRDFRRDERGWRYANRRRSEE